METLFTTPLWWHWMAFGLILVAAEIVVPSFVIIWFGLAAIVVAVLEWVFSIHFATQLFWWIVLSVLFLYIWLKKYKPKKKTTKGESHEDMGTEGIVTEAVEPFGRGRARFEAPVLGSSEWVVTADEKIEVGEKVICTEAMGNMLKVKRRRR